VAGRGGGTTRDRYEAGISKGKTDMDEQKRQCMIAYLRRKMAKVVANIKFAFGEQEVVEAIRRDRVGDPRFFACENGRSVGTASPAQTDVRRVDGAVRDRH